MNFVCGLRRGMIADPLRIENELECASAREKFQMRRTVLREEYGRKKVSACTAGLA